MKTAKILIAYFSLSGETYVNGKLEYRSPGNTAVVAERLSRLTGADLFHIEKSGGYPSTYRGTVEVAKQEWASDARPGIEGHVENMGQYDVVVLGYPNWCGTMPKAVCTFLESYPFTGKRIVPFCTNEGSGLGQSVNDLKKLCPEAEISEGVAIHGAEAASVQEELEEIIRQLS